MLEVTREDVNKAAERIARLVERTPLMATDIRRVRAWLKCECLQTGGAFKLRGATNRLLQLSEKEKQRGVVAFSSGNHARGVAGGGRGRGRGAANGKPAHRPPGG